MVWTRRRVLWLVVAAMATAAALAPTTLASSGHVAVRATAGPDRILRHEAPTATAVATRPAPDDQQHRLRPHLPLWVGSTTALAVALLALAWAGTSPASWRPAVRQGMHPARGPPRLLLHP